MKKVIVIGAGISGLAAGIYAQRSGFDVTICEQHSIAGGMCTSWKRKGYMFEGAVHWMTGSGPRTVLYPVWKETGALRDDVKIFLHEPFCAVECEGHDIYLYRDIRKTAEHLAVVSPEDEKQLKRLVSDVKAFSRIQIPVYDIKGVKSENPKRMSIGSIFRMLPAFPVAGKLGKISCLDYTKQFTHTSIQRLLRFLPDDYSAISLIATLSTLDSGDGGYPEGGSPAIVERMAKTFRDLGGNLLLNTKVMKVSIGNPAGTETAAVTGVMLDNGTSSGAPAAADAVIVSQETIAAVNQLFDQPLRDEWLADLCKNTKPAVCTFVGVGIRAKITQSPVPVWTLREPIVCAGKTITEIGFNNYAGFKGYAPEGCTTLTTAFMGDTYDFWKKAKDEGRYEDEKRRLADQISRAICRKFPQAEGSIEVIDIATPLTYERYTGAYHGSWMSIAGAGDKMKSYPGSVRGVSGLYFTGHRLMSPGGLPVALTTGRSAAQMVCRQFGTVFKGRP